MTLDYDVARTVCTPAELVALHLADEGLSQFRIALALGISRRSVRDRLDSAYRKIACYHDTTQETA